jgi:hypothetical protein
MDCPIHLQTTPLSARTWAGLDLFVSGSPGLDDPFLTYIDVDPS